MPTINLSLKQKNIVGVFSLLLLTVFLLKLTWALTAFTPGSQPIGYVAQDEISSFDMTSGSETLYRPEYNREFWGGNLHAYPVDAAGNVNIGAPRWAGGASAQIALQDWDTERFIGTMKDDGSKVPFRSDNLSSTQAGTLAGTINGTAYTSTQIVNFLRGDTSNEGSGGLRQRTSPLGDIVHSRPFYVDDDTAPTVFVGANDGMLHAINADTGQERWAYVPSMLLSKMKNLANNPYTHDYFVDGQVVVGDITVSSASKRVLFGSLGAGGKGLYALDVDTLTASSDQDVANKLLWEITPSKINGAASSSYARLGYTYGTPILTKVKSGSNSIDVLIVGNGYDDGATGQAFIYVINAATGVLVQAIQAGTSGSANPNGIFNPVAIDTDNDGNADRVYAGDLNGTMWKFDLSSTTPSSWSSSALHTTSPAQPITATPGVATHPNGGYMVNFATGKVLTGDYGVYNQGTHTWTTASTGDLADTSTFYVYGIWDGAPSANTALLTQTLTESTYTDAAGISTRVRKATANVPDWTSGTTHHKGWKVALPGVSSAGGERVVGEGAFIENGRFYFNTYNPTVAPVRVSGTDTDIFGENWLMELNYLTGGSSNSPFLDLNGDLLLSNLDRLSSSGTPITSPNEDGIPVGKWIATGVQSQPILVQLQTLNTTLFNQNPDVIFPATTTAVRGVAGGHFDIDYFYGPTMNCSNVSGIGSVASGGYFDFTYSGDKTYSSFSIKINGVELLTSSSPGKQSSKNLENWVISHYNSADYTLVRKNNRIEITANVTGSALNATTTNMVVSGTGVSSSDYSKRALTGGTDASTPVSGSSTTCMRNVHDHEYDDQYDKTGLNMLKPSDTAYQLSKAIGSTSTQFKVLMMNQYLSPAVSIHIGDATYNPSSSAGYVSVKNYQTAATLDIATVPTYTRDTIGSLVLNMPVDAFTVRDWWGTGDLRAGLHSTMPQCAYSGLYNSDGDLVGSEGADLYTPVIPPADGTDGAGTSGITTGARHNGTLTVQIIKASTPASAIEQNVSGRPQYGYRVKHADFYNYVLAEYIIYWHHPRRICYGDSTTTWYNGTSGGGPGASASTGAWNTTTLMAGTGWTKAPPDDQKTTSASATPATGSADPKLGTFGSTGTVSDVTTTVVGNVTTTTTTFTDGTSTVVTQTRNSNGTVTIRTVNRDASGGSTTSEITVADAAGNVKTGGDERGLQARTGRISWRELFRP